MDGHVEFHANLALDGGQLIDYQSGLPVSDIRRAVNPGAKAFDFLGQVF
jgi:hypothetical protein